MLTIEASSGSTIWLRSTSFTRATSPPYFRADLSTIEASALIPMEYVICEDADCVDNVEDAFLASPSDRRAKVTMRSITFSKPFKLALAAMRICFASTHALP